MKNYGVFREVAIKNLRDLGLDVSDHVSASKLAYFICLQRKVSVVGKISKAHGRRIIKNFAEKECEQPVQVNNNKSKARPRDFFVSPSWKEVRYRALVLHGGKCQCCGASRKDGKQMHVDHIKPRSKYPELALDINNLQVLCEDCNLGKSNTDETDWRPTLVVNNG
jgi:5-methylcytosine-specific restriction endonuclease McrA